MMRIKFVAVSALLALYLLLGGCLAAPASSDAINENQSISGGQNLGSGVNLKDITVGSDEKSTVISLYFIQGSRNSKAAETKLNAVPTFSASLLSFPQRLSVTLDVDYWDYQPNGSWYRSSLVGGSFKTTNSANNKLTVFFQLTGSATASFAENSDRLVITLKPQNSPAQNSYFVGLNAYEEYEQNLIPADLGFTPTLCADGSNIMLISAPFSAQADADAFAAKVSGEVSSAAATKKPYTFQLNAGSLPQYNSNIDLEEVSQKLVLQVDGKGQTLPVLVENGRYLCTAPDGSIVYARSYFPETNEDASSTLNERLWVIGQNDKKTELNLPNFSFVEEAAFSGDGKYLAILDTSAHAKVLYVYVMGTGELKNLGEEGFGDITSSFAWDTGRDTIYAMTGHTSMQLLQYDFDRPAGSRIKPVGTTPGTESPVATGGKNLYIADPSAGTSGQIFAVNIATGLRSPIAPGISFKLSPDGNYLATLVPSAATGQDLFNLDVVNLSSGQILPVMSGIYVEDYEFGVDSSDLFFTTSSYVGISGIYHNAFLKYSVTDGISKLIGYSTADMIRRGQTPSEMYLIDYFDAQQENFYVTYIYTVK